MIDKWVLDISFYVRMDQRSALHLCSLDEALPSPVAPLYYSRNKVIQGDFRDPRVEARILAALAGDHAREGDTPQRGMLLLAYVEDHFMDDDGVLKPFRK